MRRRDRVFVVSALLVALALAGVVSFWASGSPDGLEKVAADTGFGSTQTTHGSDDSPLAGYEAKGVADPWLSGATAGVAGVVICFAVAGGIGFAVRRRSRRRDDRPDADVPS